MGNWSSLLKASGLTALALASACNADPPVRPLPAAPTGKKNAFDASTGSAGNKPGSGSGTPTSGTGSTTLPAANAGAGEPHLEEKAIDFPVLTLNGTGSTNCGQNLKTDTQIVSKLSQTELRVERARIHMDCYTKNFWEKLNPFGDEGCSQPTWDEKIFADARGATVYTRYTALDASGVKPVGWAIMASGITSNKGDQYRFDKPIPVFPMPAAIARYRELDQPQTFTTNVSGARIMQATLVVQKMGVSGDEISIRYTLTLNGADNHADYDKFPMPKQSDFVVNTKTLDIRRMVTKDWFTDKYCENSGEAYLSYELCRKQTAKKTEDFPTALCK